MAKKDHIALKNYLKLVDRIQTQTRAIPQEDKQHQQKRIKRLLSNPEDFFKYYFGHYIDADFAWFHKEVIQSITDTDDNFTVGELPREHAKSVLVNVFIPLYLKAKGELTGMMIGSSTGDKANVLLSGIQAELEHNQLYINDFGQQVSYADWRNGHFVTTDGIGFWAFGRGQSPRGVRVGSNRPNYGVIDDIDDKVLVKNIRRVRDCVQWILEDFYGAMSIQASRLVVVGNRIHKESVLAHIVGDVEPEDPKREGITHIKAYAVEDPVTREKSSFEAGGVPAWNRYTKKQLLRKFKRQGHIAARREFFHEHIEEGLIFKHDWIQFGKMLEIEKYDSIVVYCDPSFTHNQGSDFKAIVAVGKKGKKYHVLWCWVRQASILSMVGAFYDAYDIFGDFASYWIEANMLQSTLLEEFDSYAEAVDFAIPIRPDKTKKPNKQTRIESLSPLFERGLFLFNEKCRKDRDMQTLKSQLIGFGGGAKDDAPDALEGAKSKLNKKTRKSRFKARTGKLVKKRKNNGKRSMRA